MPIQHEEAAPSDADGGTDALEDADDGTPRPSVATDQDLQTTPSPDESTPDPEPDRNDAEAAPEKSVELSDTNGETAVDLHSRPISPEPEASGAAGTGQQSGAKRKLFGWLSRNTSGLAGDKSTRSPSGRRDTANSVMSNGSAVERPQSRGEDDTTASLAHRLYRNSLKDRFKLVRMREEAGIVSLDDTEGSRPGSSEGPREGGNEPGQENADASGESRKRTSSSASMPGQPTINVLLPPGTAAGTSAGPDSEAAEPVDWDLWQEVVYDGPAAVARTSGDELTKATMRGIPSAIRGVVWQVLAQSKNEELEVVYKDLVARGISGQQNSMELRPRPASRSRSRSERDPSLNRKEQDSSVRSPRSSVHSDADPSSTGISRRNSGGVTSPPTSHEGGSLQTLADDQIKALEDEKIRQKEDAASLQKLERAIRRDLGARTSYSKFLISSGLQDGLFGICKAYALFDEEVGYAQGMNFIAMPLLFNMVEEEAFCLFVRLMNNYKLRDLFIPEMPGLHLHLYQFERLLEDYLPAVYCHLHRRGVSPQLYATQWFLTLFAYRFPLQLVLRIYDLILSEGLDTAILKFGIVLMQKNAKQLLEMKDMAVLTTFLKERLFDCYIDRSPSASSVLESGFFGSAGGIDREVYRADELVCDACAVQITPEMLKVYTSEWEEKTRDEKQRVAAEDALRSSNTSLTLQARSLQERCEKSDAEHVQIASELVRTKVENQRLIDENESMHGRINELQGIVQAQPGEVEDKLRQEMDRIMKRNIEVQNESRALEDSTAEMEQELISTKLKHAEISEELDNMRQKWSNISHMMGGLASPPAS